MTTDNTQRPTPAPDGYDENGAPFRYMRIVRGRGTEGETTITTSIKMYQHAGQWMTIPA